MLSPRWRKIARDAWLHKSRTALVILAIALGITGAGAVLDTWSLLRRATESEFLATRPASATLRVEGLSNPVLNEVRALEQVEAAQTHRTVVASILVNGVWRTGLLFSRPSFTDQRIGIVRSVSGSWPPEDGGLVIERSSVDSETVPLGSTVTVRVERGPAVTLTVTGIAQDRGLAPGWMEHAVYGFATPSTLAQLGARPDPDELQILTRHPWDREGNQRAAEKVKSLLQARGLRVRDVSVPVPGRHVHAAQMDSLFLTQGAFGGLTLILSAFLVVNLVSAMLAAQLREVGVMKALGGRRTQLARMYLGQALILGAAACAIGVPAAAVIGRAYGDFAASMLNFDINQVSIPAWVLALQLVVGGLLPVVASAFPVARGCGLSVGEALRGTATSAPVSSPLFEKLAGSARPLLLALRNAFRQRARMALTVVTLAVGGAVYLGSLDLQNTVRRTMDALLGNPRFDLMVRLTKPAPALALESILRKVPSVAEAEAWSTGHATIVRQDGELGNRLTVVGLPPGSHQLAPSLLEGRWLRAGDGDVLVVNRHTAQDEPSFRIGGEVRLQVEGRTSTWKVVGMVDGGVSIGLFAPRDAVAAGAGGATGAVVRFVGPANLSQAQMVRSALEDEGLEVSSTSLTQEQRKVAEDHMLMVASFLGVMGQLMMVVGGLGLASTMSIAVLERQREIGVLRALGASRRAILGIFQVEALVIATVSWLAAIPLSLPMSLILTRAFGKILLEVPPTFLPGVGGVARWLVLVVVVSFVAASWPAWRATKVTAAKALAYE
jgi:putative ABC transport system permease protein